MFSVDVRVNGITISTINAKNVGLVDISNNNETLTPLSIYKYEYHEAFKKSNYGIVHHYQDDGMLQLVKKIINDVETARE